MDTQARIEAARARLNSNRALASRAADTGAPCVLCRHYRPSRRCNHLAFSEVTFDAVSGTIAAPVRMSAEDARKPEGLCGPEALLFEPLPIPVQALIVFHQSEWSVPSYLLGGGAAAVWFLSLLGFQ